MNAVQVLVNNIPQQKYAKTRKTENGQKRADRHILSRYIWGFCTSPKREAPGPIAGKCYRITWAGHWEFENLPLVHVHHTNANGTRLLARVLVGKVLNTTALEAILSGSTIRQHVGWNYREWMADAMRRLRADAQAVLPDSEREQAQAVTSLVPADWPHIRSVSRQYVRSRIAHGRYKPPFSANEPIPTYCMSEYRVLIP
jgi:hypothetical protein